MAQLAKPLHVLVGPARGRLLDALRSGPDAGVHLRELARGAGLSLSSVQTELDRLYSLGVLSRTLKGNRVFHGLRREAPFARLLLAAATALELGATEFKAMPSDRGAEEVFVKFCANLPPDPALWRQFGDPEFLGGVAVMLAGHSGYDRASYLALAETLHPGASSVEQYGKWHRTYRPDFPRLFSMIDRERRTHARAGHQ
jgi:DNA-binding transcriptional ArsR family regulator